MPRVNLWQAVSFWTEKLTKVLIWAFLKINISSVMQIETQGLKNKVFKTHGPLDYLTQKYNTIIWKYNTTELTELPHYIINIILCSFIINTNKT
jgi:hypothetical protein